MGKKEEWSPIDVGFKTPTFTEVQESIMKALEEACKISKGSVMHGLEGQLDMIHDMVIVEPQKIILGDLWSNEMLSEPTEVNFSEGYGKGE